MSTTALDSRGTEMAIVSIVVTVISVVAVALRCYTMSAILKRFLIEDWLAVITCVLQVAFCTFVLLGISHGLGSHVADIAEDERPKALLWKWAGQVAYIVVSTMVKFVVGIFLLRLCLNNGWQRITIWTLLVLVGVYNTFYVFIAIFQCQPIAFYWWRYANNPAVTGRCNGKALATIPTYIAVLLGLAGDLILALLPISLVKDAKLDKKTKVSVVCVLALGSMASVATVARIPYAKQLLSNPDYLYNFTDLAIWSIVECGIAITASSLATLRPFFVKLKFLAQSNFTSRFGSSKNTSGLPTMNTKISATGMSSRQRDTGRMTGMTGVVVGSGNLMSVMEKNESSGGITVDKQFEMSIITRETSKDSLDDLEAEVNEVIRPGTSNAPSSRSFGNPRGRSGSTPGSTRPSYKPVPIQTPGSAMEKPRSIRSTITSISGPSSPAFPPPQTGHIAHAAQPKVSMASSMKSIGGSLRKGRPSKPSRLTTEPFGTATFGSAHSDDFTSPSAPHVPPPPIRGHQSNGSEGSLASPRTSGSPPPAFHLPTRMAHQSIASSHSSATASTARSIASARSGASISWVTKLPPPPRLVHTSQGAYTPIVEGPGPDVDTKSAPRSRSRSRPSGSRPPTANSPNGVRFPFENFTEPGPLNEFPFEHFTEPVRKAQRQLKKETRTSAFLDDGSDDEGAGHREQHPRQSQPADIDPEPPRTNPLRSNPTMASQPGNWM